MTAISVLIGVIFKQVPDVFTTSLPVTEYIAVALLVYFGVRSIKVWPIYQLPLSTPLRKHKQTETRSGAHTHSLCFGGMGDFQRRLRLLSSHV
jgi:hypothetical protein